MKINIHRLAGVGFGAALAIMLSVDVEAAPLNNFARPLGNFRLRRLGHASNKPREGQARVAPGPSYA
jgi:hypothetical protein